MVNSELVPLYKVTVLKTGFPTYHSKYLFAVPSGNMVWQKLSDLSSVAKAMKTYLFSN